jgi:hypothetical protein
MHGLLAPVFVLVEAVFSHARSSLVQPKRFDTAIVTGRKRTLADTFKTQHIATGFRSEIKQVELGALELGVVQVHRFAGFDSVEKGLI